MRVVLNLLNAVSQLYSYCLLVKFEREWFTVVSSVKTRRNRLRTATLLFLTTAAFVSPLCRGLLSILREIEDPMRFSNVRISVIAMYTPLRIVWHVAVFLYLVAVLGIVDEIENFRRQLRSSPYVASLPRAAILFKEKYRRKVELINRMFSFFALQIYFKIFKATLISVAMIVIQRGTSETLAWVLPAIHYTLEAIALSSASSLIIRGLQSCTDTVSFILQQRYSLSALASPQIKSGLYQDYTSIPHFATSWPTDPQLQMSALKTTIDFDEVRDSLTIFDLFVLRKSTTMTFFVGMVSCISIILQFDNKINPVH